MCKCEKCGAQYTIEGYTCDQIVHYCLIEFPKPPINYDDNTILDTPEQPSTLQRLGNFTKALTRHITGGMKKANQQQIDARFAICQACPLFNGEICTHKKCGCNINNKEIFLNKLAWADQSCPIGKWGPIVD